MTVNHDVAGSNPASGASGLFVKWLRHRPFTAGSRVRISHRSPWAISSAGRASALQAECQQFDPVIAHQKKSQSEDSGWLFSLCFLWSGARDAKGGLYGNKTFESGMSGFISGMSGVSGRCAAWAARILYLILSISPRIGRTTCLELFNHYTIC